MRKKHNFKKLNFSGNLTSRRRTNRRNSCIYNNSVRSIKGKSGGIEYPERRFCTCGRSFIYTRQYAYHKRVECGRSFACKNCKKEFITKNGLLGHIKKCLCLRSNDSSNSFV